MDMGIINRPSFEKTIADLVEGEIAYALPWSLAFDENEVPYLNLSMPVTKKPQGTSAMPIKKVGPNNNDYDINLNFEFFDRKYTWDKQTEPFSGIFGGGDLNIVQLNYGSEEKNFVSSMNNLSSIPSIRDLQINLNAAIKNQDYELAANYRDEINSHKKGE